MGEFGQKDVNGDGLFANIPKFIALVGVLPVLLLFLWFTWKLAATPRVVQATWTSVEAYAVEGAPEGKVLLEWTWNDRVVRREVDRKDGYDNVAPGSAFPLYVNPADTQEIRPGGFARLWGGVMAVGSVVLFLALVGAFLWRVKSPEMPADFAAQFQRSFPDLRESDTPMRHADDGRIIVIREPRESWKANVFWGVLFGLLLIVPAVFAPADASALKRYGLMALGFAWMGFMSRKAMRNRGRRVRCDGTSIEILEPSGSRGILLSEVQEVTRSDERRKIRDIRDIGLPRYETKPLDTLAPMVVFILRDAQGTELLRLDQKMEPSGEMRRFLDRMENLTGRPIRDE